MASCHGGQCRHGCALGPDSPLAERKTRGLYDERIGIAERGRNSFDWERGAYFTRAAAHDRILVRECRFDIGDRQVPHSEKRA
ncbi:MAG: hypothetical protein QOG97_1664 [Acidimicrobiaceae bacterium]|nr:hypothetical protein [Acidimicrobiaceae bacterium]